MKPRHGTTGVPPVASDGGVDVGRDARPTTSLVRRWLWLPLLALTVLLTVAGLRAGQWQDVEGWFNAVCSACIGLTFR